ncbi:alpha/beta hydrolase [Synechococcales cyanobacterium C]|uniref:Alpha/beta hydrolase n=1 Tax=Petrachloros mirabilis ULC683 TaxID=2781853 RepID=A0A8K2A148_9CYAN|nr:alpha/beta hydrolase [Petrachloros mirabilis]NCJ07703.1 alpha/beta hydrolase [Petrachloros mirabilis ULC683]
MLFITNRVLNEGPTPVREANAGLPRSVSFDLKNNQAEQSVYFCRRDSANTYTEIGSQVFLSELRNRNVKEILFYIHGYNNLPEPAIFPRAQTLQSLFNLKSPNYVQVVPLIWPCDNNFGQVRDYFNDQIAADQSGVAYSRLFQKFLDWREQNSNEANPCTKRINILAHSMGNRVLRAAFADTVHYFLPQGIPLIFRNIFMAAADLVNEALESGKEGQHIPSSARNVAVYFAADDLAMRASKVANVAHSIASKRLGHTGPENIFKVSKNVYALDCADFNNTYDPPMGHGYFAEMPSGEPGLVFEHIWRCMQTGRVPMGGLGGRTAILSNNLLT